MTVDLRSPESHFGRGGFVARGLVVVVVVVVVAMSEFHYVEEVSKDKLQSHLLRNGSRVAHPPVVAMA